MGGHGPGPHVHRVAVGDRTARLGRRRVGRAPGLLGVRRPAREPVSSELGRQLVRTRRRPGHGVRREGMGDLRVHPGPAALWDRVVDGIACECVGEGIPVGRVVDEQACGTGRFQDVLDLVRVVLIGGRDGLDPERAADHGCGAEGSDRLGRQRWTRRITTSRTVAGHRGVVTRVPARRVVHRRAEPGELEEEERVALAARVPGRGDVSRHLGRHRLHQGCGVLDGQAGELEPQALTARKGLARLGECSARLRVGAARRRRRRGAPMGVPPRAGGAGCAGSRRRPSAGRRGR